MAIIITVRRFRATWSWEEQGIQTDRQIKWKGKGLAARISAPREPQGPGMGFQSSQHRDPPSVRWCFGPGPALQAAQEERSPEGWQARTPGPEPGTQQPGEPPGGQKERGLFVLQEESGHGNEL